MVQDKIDRQYQSHYSGIFNTELRSLLRRPFLPGPWFLMVENPSDELIWERFDKHDGSIAAIREVRIHGELRWAVFTLIENVPGPIVRLFKVCPKFVPASVFNYRKTEDFDWLIDADDVKKLRVL